MTERWLVAQQEAPDPSQVSAGWTGLIVLILLALATAFLLRSMNRRLKGIDFDEDHADEEREGGGGSPSR